MKRLVDWYWEHGINRPIEWSISPSGLNTVMGIANRNDAIQKNRESDRRKACVAFWGPSQSGKSSLLSHYLDGTYDSDLALMWDETQKVRFSAYQNGEGVDADCVVFNPFNCAMDASGLVTRFYLPTDEEAKEIIPEAPVEVILANRKQVMHAIAVGYRQECQESENPWGLTQLQQKISTPSVRPSREAFELLFDVCDVCENMAREASRYREFVNGPKLRQQILASSYVDDVSEAMTLAAYLLWDEEAVLTDLFNDIMSIKIQLDTMRDKSAPNRLFVSMEMASFLEDIGILSFYEQNIKGNTSEEAKRRLKSLKNMYISATPYGLICTCNKKYPSQKTGKVSVNWLGHFQALIGELKIPVRKKSTEKTKSFFNFLEKIDLLDIPGVTNRATGEHLGVENLINLSDNPTKTMLLSRVYKSGKTLSIVYSQADNCSIDAFVVFVDLERAGGISRPSTIVNGIKAWLSPYGFTSFTNRPPLKLYLNCSLFGKLMDKVIAAVNGGGLGNYCEKVEVLDFSRSHYVDYFFTTNCFAPCSDKSKASYFEKDPQFSSLFLSGAGKKSLEALFGDGLGTDFMFDKLSEVVTVTERFSRYELIKTNDHATLKSDLSRILPNGQDACAEMRKDVAKSVYNRLMEFVDEQNPEHVRKLAAFVKALAFVDEKMLDTIPVKPHRIHDSEIREYLLRQIRKWVSMRKEELIGDKDFAWLVKENETYSFLEAISSIDLNRLVQLLKTDFWNHNPKVSRSFLAMILANSFLWGDYERTKSGKRTDAYEMLCMPFMNRLQQLSTTSYVQEGGRPSNLDGDVELLEIVTSLNLV